MGKTQILFIVAIILGCCGGFYFAMKLIEKKSEKKKTATIGTIPNLTMDYIKDWIATETGSKSDHSVTLAQPSWIEGNIERNMIEGLLPEKVRKKANVLLLIARKKEDISRIHVIQYDTMDESLEKVLKDAKGILRVTA